MFFLIFFANKNKTLIPIILDEHNIERMFGHTYSEVTGNSVSSVLHTCPKHYTEMSTSPALQRSEAFRIPLFVEPWST